MRTKVVNTDFKGINGVQDLIDRNPEWQIVTCGASLVESNFVNGQDYAVNFAVFQTADPYVLFYEL